MKQSEQEFAKIMWRSKRGMLELDLILIPFVKNHFNDLSPEFKSNFKALLKCDDPDLYAWLMGFQEVDNKEFENIVQHIRKLSNTNKI